MYPLTPFQIDDFFFINVTHVLQHTYKYINAPWGCLHVYDVRTDGFVLNTSYWAHNCERLISLRQQSFLAYSFLFRGSMRFPRPH